LIPVLGFAVIAVGALQLGAPQLLQARAVDECPVQGVKEVCLYDLCTSTEVEDHLWACLYAWSVEEDERCCVSADPDQCEYLGCDPSYGVETDRNECFFWTYSPEDPCPFIE
jgi:hypothetical protein